jgi:hypothetical protein
MRAFSRCSGSAFDPYLRAQDTSMAATPTTAAPGPASTPAAATAASTTTAAMTPAVGTAVAPSAATATSAAAPAPAAADPSGRHICVLCKRVLPSAEALQKHEQFSELHKVLPHVLFTFMCIRYRPSMTAVSACTHAVCSATRRSRAPSKRRFTASLRARSPRSACRTSWRCARRPCLFYAGHWWHMHTYLPPAEA